MAKSESPQRRDGGFGTTVSDDQSMSSHQAHPTAFGSGDHSAFKKFARAHGGSGNAEHGSAGTLS